MVSFVLETGILNSDRAHVLPGGDECVGAVTSLSGTHFTAYVAFHTGSDGPSRSPRGRYICSEQFF